MATSIECCIHIVSDENGPILPISEKTLQTIKDSAEKWRQLNGVEREVGVKAQLSDVQPGPLCTAGFHMPCYRRFTDKTKIARSVKRCAKLGQPSLVSQAMTFLPQGKVCVMLSVLPVARQFTSQREKNINVLPEQCIICKGEKYNKNSYSKKRQREKLSVCEYTLGELEVN